MRTIGKLGLAAALALMATPLGARESDVPVLAARTSGTPDERAAAVLARMSLGEKLR